MGIMTIDSLPRTVIVSEYIDNIAIFENVKHLSGLTLPAKIDFVLSILCEQGELSIMVDLERRELRARSLMVLKPGHLINSFKASPDFRGHCIVVSSSAFGDTIPSLSRFLPTIVHFMKNPVLQLSASEVVEQVELRNILRRNMHAEEHPYKKQLVDALLESLFYATIKIYTSHLNESSGMSMKRKEDLFMRFIDLVENLYRQERSVAFYADKLNVSPKHLSAVIKGASGRTAGEWIDSYVILDAKMLLRNTGMTIQEISARLNFANQSFFGKYFKHLTGMSPREFRGK